MTEQEIAILRNEIISNIDKILTDKLFSFLASDKKLSEKEAKQKIYDYLILMLNTKISQLSD